MIGSVAWIDGRIDKKLSDKFTGHEAAQALHRQAMLDKIEHLREMLTPRHRE